MFGIENHHQIAQVAIAFQRRTGREPQSVAEVLTAVHPEPEEQPWILSPLSLIP